LRYSSWKGMYAGHVRREMNRYMRTRPQPRVTVRQYDSNQRAFKPAEQKPKTVDLLPLVLALVAVALGAVVLSLPAPPSLQIPEVEAQH
jgi:hypothetical protein